MGTVGDDAEKPAKSEVGSDSRAGIAELVLPNAARQGARRAAAARHKIGLGPKKPTYRLWQLAFSRTVASAI